MLVIVWPIGFVFAIIKMSFKLSFKRLVEIENKIKLIFEHQYPIKCQKASIMLTNIPFVRTADKN